MKVLLINENDLGGGAGRAAFRLNKALETIGVDSKMLVQSKIGEDSSVIAPKGKVEKGINAIRPHLDSLPLFFYPGRKKVSWSVSWLPDYINKKIVELKPDILHLHWICKGFINLNFLLHIKVPLVWTFHDCWAFTGGCHYPGECEKYLNSCGSCPELGSNFFYDLSRWNYNKKSGIYKKLSGRMTVVTPSKWMADLGKKSSLLKDFRFEVIPNCIDTNIFKPVNKDIARGVLNLPKDKKLILFGAMSATSDMRKGFHFLLPALNILSKDMKDMEILVFGSSKPEKPPEFPFPAHYCGRLHDDISLVLLYSAADVVIVPSLQDNLPNVIMEGMACAKPVIAFNTGGISDMIEHKSNGYLAKAFSPEDFAEGIKWVLSEDCRYKDLCIKAREKVLNFYSPEIVANKHLALYKRLSG